MYFFLCTTITNNDDADDNYIYNCTYGAHIITLSNFKFQIATGTQRSFWLGGALNHVFVHGEDAKRPKHVSPAGMYPSKFTYDISFWILDETKYKDVDIIALCLQGEHVRSVKYESEILVVPRDENISTSAIRTVVFRITYQSQKGPMSREMMLEKHDLLREQLGHAMLNVILVRGSIAFQKTFLNSMDQTKTRIDRKFCVKCVYQNVVCVCNQ